MTNSQSISMDNLEWVGAFGSWKGVPALPVALPEFKENHAKTFQTTIKITEKKATKNQNFVIKCEFTEFSSNFPMIHNASSYEGYFPSAEDFPHNEGDVIRAEVSRVYIKCESDNNNNVVGVKDGTYENHFIHKVNWNTWTKVDSEEVQSEIQQIDPKTQDIQKQVENNSNPKTITFNDERGADRVARNVNNSDSIAGNLIIELWKAGRFPQLKENTELIDIAVQIKFVSKILQGENPLETKNEYGKYLSENGLKNVLDWGQG